MEIWRFVIGRDKAVQQYWGADMKNERVFTGHWSSLHTHFRVDEEYHQRGAIKMDCHIQLVPTGESG